MLSVLVVVVLWIFSLIKDTFFTTPHPHIRIQKHRGAVCGEEQLSSSGQKSSCCLGDAKSENRYQYHSSNESSHFNICLE